MAQPSMTIETVHGLRETVIFNNFTLGIASSKMECDSERKSSDQEESAARTEKQN
jgi:hypothetical protein